MPLEYKDMTPEQKAAKKARVTAWRKANPERARANLRNSYQRHKEKRKTEMRAWRGENAERKKETDARWREENRERHRELAREHAAKKYATPEGKAYFCAKSVTRCRGLKKATPKWADLTAIAAFYAARPPGHEVDHIIPLRGKHVCGLHVLENLQYLPVRENRSKFNRVLTGE